MRLLRSASAMVSTAACALLLALPACAPDDGAGAGGGGSQAASGAYKGTYEVPTVTANLASAAVYPVPEVEWSIVDGVAELSYDLPLGLVGAPLRVKFTGALAASGTPSALAGEPGTASCDVANAAVVCHEIMRGLLPLTPDYAVVEQMAATEYAGPATDRLDVAKLFASDPIGIVKIDMNAPVAGHVEVETEKPED